MWPVTQKQSASRAHYPRSHHCGVALTVIAANGSGGPSAWPFFLEHVNAHRNGSRGIAVNLNLAPLHVEFASAIDNLRPLRRRASASTPKFDTRAMATHDAALVQSSIRQSCKEILARFTRQSGNWGGSHSHEPQRAKTAAFPHIRAMNKPQGGT